TPAADQVGSHDVAVQVVDARGAGVTQSFTIRVRGANLFPAINSVPPTQGALGQEYVYAVDANDPDGDPLTFSLTAAPAGMTIDAAGRLTWTPAVGQLGNNLISVAATDPLGNVATQTFTIVVKPTNRLPAIASTPLVGAVPGQAYHYDVRGTDPDGD